MGSIVSSTFIEHEGKRYRIRPSKKQASGYTVVVRMGWYWRIVTNEQSALVLTAAKTAGRIK